MYDEIKEFFDMLYFEDKYFPLSRLIIYLLIL